MCSKLLQSCPTLCMPMDYSPPGSSVHGILQARILEWIGVPSSRGSSQPRDRTLISPTLVDGFFATSTIWEAHRRKIHQHNKGHIWQVKSLSHVRLFVTQWTIAYKVPLPMECSRQEYWSGFPFPSPSHANIILNGERLKAFSVRLGTKQDANFHHSYKYSAGSPSHRNQAKQTNKETKQKQQ